MMIPALALALVFTQTPPPTGEAPTNLPEVEVQATAHQGTVVLNCAVEADGRLSGCTVVSETPPGHGFAEAALRGARRARVSARTVDGARTGSRVTFTTRFRLE